ncbi:MAG: hypothetical protein IPN71_13240 [Fibrobacteres bacterium]|jgi:uncharacterized protein YcfL|nr:hypothetical protein [Fibrobacterota bacterium]
MKKLALLAAVSFLFVACNEPAKTDVKTADTVAVAKLDTVKAVDTTLKADTTKKADTVKVDTTKKADTAKKADKKPATKATSTKAK